MIFAAYHAALILQVSHTDAAKQLNDLQLLTRFIKPQKLMQKQSHRTPNRFLNTTQEECAARNVC